jgi:hypothetical protein
MRLKKFAAGRWHVRDENGRRLPGEVIGGNRRYAVIVGGRQLPELYRSASIAGARLAGDYGPTLADYLDRVEAGETLTGIDVARYDRLCEEWSESEAAASRTLTPNFR